MLPSLTISSPEGATRTVLSVELATTPAQWAQGYMGRTEVPDGTGMLFVFPDVAPRSFWMKNTPVALDMLFADAGGTIHTIAADVPSCERQHCPLIHGGDAQFVLEVGAGQASALGIREGDQMDVAEFEDPRP